MSIFDEEDQMKSVDETVQFMVAQEKMLLRCVIPGTVKCVVFAPNINIMLKKLHEIYGISINETSFATYIQTVLDKACHSAKAHKHRRVVSLDCRGLKKGDALGWIREISKDDKDAIVVLENVTQIPEGDPALYDPKQYVENILVRSWKNNDIYIDDYHIDRRNLTLILTCPPEDEEQLRAVCSICSYAWVGDIEKKIESKLAEL